MSALVLPVDTETHRLSATDMTKFLATTTLIPWTPALRRKVSDSADRELRDDLDRAAVILTAAHLVDGATMLEQIERLGGKAPFESMIQQILMRELTAEVGRGLKRGWGKPE